MKNILITGGCGFIGSHVSLSFLKNNYNVTIIDSNLNSSPTVVERIKMISSLNNEVNINNLKFQKGDLRDYEFLTNVFKFSKDKDQRFDCVIHLAGLKSISQSLLEPVDYWDVNVYGTINLLKVMQENNCRSLIFSSSAAIYDYSNGINIKESFPKKAINPYAKTKLSVEYLLKDLFSINKKEWRIANLRYFNPIGADPSGLIGEDQLGLSTNIFPQILKVASKKINKLKIYGNDWPTLDRTCIRDYVHIVDLALGHFKMYEYIIKNKPNFYELNLGTGIGTSVLELLKTFEKVNNISIPFEFVSRRVGDKPILVADNSLCKELLNWIPNMSIEDMCRDGWNWYRSKKNLNK